MLITRSLVISIILMGYQQHHYQAYQQRGQPIIEQELPDVEQEEPVVEQERPNVEQEQPNVEQEQPQQQRGVPVVEYEVGPDGYGGGPSEASLLPHFGRHVAFWIWVDANVSIFNVYLLDVGPRTEYLEDEKINSQPSDFSRDRQHPFFSTKVPSFFNFFISFKMKIN